MSRKPQIPRIEPEALAVVPGRAAPSVLRRAAARRAPCVGDPPRPLADDEGVRRRSRGGSAPADGDRALRDLECRQARGRAPAAALRDARGAARRPACARRRARTDTDGGRDQAPARLDAVGVALLAHVRVAGGGAARGRLRRHAGRGAARARDLAGRDRWRGRSDGCRSSATGARRGSRTSRC